MTGPGEAIRVEGLTVEASGRRLFDGADLTIPTGQLALLVGGSGSGKSVLLRLLAGLGSSGLTVAGEVRTTGRVGMVFQDGALLEDLSALDNVLFAVDHGPGGADADGRARTLLADLKISADLSLATASGGQRRRVAIARALASAPDILLYDEPTAGLDPDLALQTGRLLRQTHDARGVTTVVVTHDFPALAPIADRILFLDPKTGLFEEVAADDLERLVAEGAFRTPAEAAERPAPAGRAAAGDRVVGLLAGWGAASTTALAGAAGGLVPRWRRPVWGLRFLGHFVRLVAGPTSMVYVALAGAVVGFVAIFFSFNYLPYADYVQPLVTEELLGAIGFALYRILVPILATILIAARCGAAVASDLAGRAYRREVDALRTLDASPGGYFGFGGLASLVLATPLLVGLAYLVARGVALATYGLLDPAARPAWTWVQLHAELVTREGLYDGTGWVLAKSLVCGAVVGLVALALAAPPIRTPAAVSRAVTRTVLFATALVLLVHFAFAFFEF